jgi:hypothetical protein
MKTKIEDGGYGGSDAAVMLYLDFLLLFDNCVLYNDDEKEVFGEATRLCGLVPKNFSIAGRSVLKEEPKGRERR